MEQIEVQKSYQLKLLGTPLLEENSTRKQVYPGASKLIALLAFLAASQKGVSREFLVALLWPESTSEAGRKNLRNTLYAIRKVSGELVVEVRGQTDHLALGSQVSSDVEQYEKIAAIGQNDLGEIVTPELVGLYRGQFLEDLSLSDCPEFESWLTLQRERYLQTYIKILLTLIKINKEQGSWEVVIQYAQLGLSQDNLLETFHQALMEAFTFRGNRAEALRQFDLLKGILERELGLEPLPETMKLRQDILQGHLIPTSTQSPIPGSEIKQVSSIKKAVQVIEANGANDFALYYQKKEPPLVGRDKELNLLDATFETLKHSRNGQVVCITGEVGLGKTRLWREWTQRPLPERIILNAHCLESAANLPYVPLVELFSNPLLVRNLVSPDSAVDPVWLTEIARILPELGTRRGNIVPALSLPPGEERRRIFESLVQGLISLQEKDRFLTIFIDDVQWADQTTLEWLGYLIGRLQNWPVMLVLAYRQEEASPLLLRLQAGWVRQGILQLIPLNRLDSYQTEELLVSLGSDPARSKQLYYQSAGNPYFLVELSQSRAEEIPFALENLIKVKLERLPLSARQLTQVAAVLEPDLDIESLYHLAGQSDEEFLDGLEKLIRAEILIEDKPNKVYRFTHPLLFQVIKQELSIARNIYLHRRVAELFEKIYATTPRPYLAASLARHYFQADNFLKATFWVEQAAIEALNLAALQEAVEFYRQAIAWTNPETEPELSGRLYLDLAKTLLQQENIEEAKESLFIALGLFEKITNSIGIARSYLELANTYLVTGDFNQVVELASQSLVCLNNIEKEETGKPEITLEKAELLTSSHFMLGAGLIQSGKSLKEGEQHLLEANILASTFNLTAVSSRISFELGNLSAKQNDSVAALKLFETALLQGRQAGNLISEMMAHNNAAFHAISLGKFKLAEEHLDSAFAIVKTNKFQFPLIWLYSTRGELALARQEWDEAEKLFRQGLSEVYQRNDYSRQANYQLNLALVTRGRGKLDKAIRELTDLHLNAKSLPDTYLQLTITLWLIQLYLENSQTEKADDLLNEAGEQLQGSQLLSLVVRLEQLKILRAG